MANPQTKEEIPARKVAPTVTVVINNTERLEIAQLPHRGVDNHKRLLLGGVVTLLPGLNLVPTEELHVLRRNPLFEEKFTTAIPDSKAPEQRPERVGKPFLVLGKELPAKAPLAALEVPEALSMVNEANEEQLAQFFAVEVRAEVRERIKIRIDEITNAASVE